MLVFNSCGCHSFTTFLRRCGSAKLHTMLGSQMSRRWKALEPGARHKLMLHLLRLAAAIVAFYAVIAIVEHSWWRPAVLIVIVVILTRAVDRARTLLRARSKRSH
jgi:hypothetical protein